jgi:ubiquinone/menaquinone biosynthesis C-methylase UbiE
LKPHLDHFGILAPSYERFIQPRIPERLMALLDLPADGVVLDAGGGTGRVAQFLRGISTHVLVADESREMLREASKKTGISPVCSHAEQLPFPSNFFDRILMVDALHHVADQRTTVKELWRVLKPGGRIVVEEPDARSFLVKLVALGEKAALMRSHFLSPLQIGTLFRYHGAHVQIASHGTTAWIVVEKEAQTIAT